LGAAISRTQDELLISNVREVAGEARGDPGLIRSRPKAMPQPGGRARAVPVSRFAAPEHAFVIVSAPQLRRTPIDRVRWDSPGAGRQIKRSDAHCLGQQALTSEASHRSLAPADGSLRLEQDNHTHVPPRRQRRPDSSCALSDSWCEWRGRSQVTACGNGESLARRPWTTVNRAGSVPLFLRE